MQTKAKYTPDQLFRLHETKPTVERVRAEVEAARQAELKFEGVKAKPVPRYPKEGAEVKLTIASVLREDALFRKKQEQEAALIHVRRARACDVLQSPCVIAAPCRVSQAYESELRDAATFSKWQSEMKSRDEQARREAVESKRAEMAAAAQMAKEARFDAALLVVLCHAVALTPSLSLAALYPCSLLARLYWCASPSLVFCIAESRCAGVCRHMDRIAALQRAPED